MQPLSLEALDKCLIMLTGSKRALVLYLRVSPYEAFVVLALFSVDSVFVDSGVCINKWGLMLAFPTHCSSQFSYLTEMTLSVVVTRENRGNLRQFI